MLDPIDIQIVNKLNSNGRISLTELAEDINLSRVAIANRIEKLVQNELMQVTASLNLEKLQSVTDENNLNKIRMIRDIRGQAK